MSRAHCDTNNSRRVSCGTPFRHYSTNSLHNSIMASSTWCSYHIDDQTPQGCLKKQQPEISLTYKPEYGLLEPRAYNDGSLDRLCNTKISTSRWTCFVLSFLRLWSCKCLGFRIWRKPNLQGVLTDRFSPWAFEQGLHTFSLWEFFDLIVGPVVGTIASPIWP